MTALDLVLPTPRLLERDSVELALSLSEVWELVRHGDLARSKLIRALFALRTMPRRLLGHEVGPLRLRIDELQSTDDEPGFQVLADDAPCEVVVGAIGKVWQSDIPFVHVADATAFAAFSEPGFVKVAWALLLAPRDGLTQLTIEVRVDATDDASWRRFTNYFRLIGPASRFIRHTVLAALVREHGSPAAEENTRPLPGDELLPDALEQVTHGLTIAANPEAIWPWLVQMGCQRAGYYSVDVLDNGGVPSAREVHPELQRLVIGDVLPATPDSPDGFEVLRIEPNQLLVLGGLFDGEANRQLPFAASRPRRYWQVTWAFVLEPLDAQRTRVHARARAAFPARAHLHASSIRFVHHFMQAAQLRHLAARVEGRLAHDGFCDVTEGIEGAAIMLAAFLTPFLRGARNHWGLSEADAARVYPGDESIAEPRWAWTHGIEIDAAAERVWPWIAQIGADRGGFYSYQWLENLVGCDLQNAEVLHDDWTPRLGGGLSLHPKLPPLEIVWFEPGRAIVARAAAPPKARASGEPWAEMTWLFLVEPLSEGRCRLISRFRCVGSSDLRSRWALSPVWLEPVGFAMDRRMLKGVKERAERKPLSLKNLLPPSETAPERDSSA